MVCANIENAIIHVLLFISTVFCIFSNDFDFYFLQICYFSILFKKISCVLVLDFFLLLNIRCLRIYMYNYLKCGYWK